MATVSTSASLAKTALVEIGIAAVTFPTAIPLASVIMINQCDPEAVITTGQVAMDFCDELDAVRASLESTVAELSQAQWHGEDRVAFEAKVADFGREVLGLRILVATMGAGMMVVGVMLFVVVIVYFVVASVLAILAALYWSALASVVFAEVAPEIFELATGIAEAGLTMVNGIVEIASTVAATVAGFIGAGMVVDTGFQFAAGNTDVLGDLLQATADGLDNAAKGILSRVERDFFAGKIAGGPNLIPALGYAGVTNLAPYNAPGADDTQVGPGGYVDNANQYIPDYNN